jgi:hypothetical protein
MLEVDPDKNLTEIRDLIRKHEDDVPELKEVKLSANKDELIDQLNRALEDYLDRVNSLDAKPEVYDEIAGADVLDVDTDDVAQEENAGEEEESGAKPYTRGEYIQTLP